MAGKLYCGAAKACITPSENLLQRLYGIMGGKFCSVLDDIFLRVIAFGDGTNKSLIISFELDKAPWPEENMAAISERTGILTDNILYFSTHTHTAPCTGKRPPFERAKDEDTAIATKEYEAFLFNSLLKTADEAIENMQPARMGYGTGMCYANINRNQNFICIGDDGKEYSVLGLGNNPEGLVDHTIFVLKAENMRGEPIAFFINYACHNVAAISNNIGGDHIFALSSDIGGAVSKFTEAKFPGCVALWSSGAAGDINPVMMNQFCFADPMTGNRMEYNIAGPDTAKSALKMMSTWQFADTLKIMRNISCNTEKANICGIVQWSSTPGKKNVPGPGPHGSYVSDPGAPPYEVRLHTLRVGDIAFIGVGGELFTSLGLAIKAVSPFKNTVIINHESSLIRDSGYIYDDDIIQRSAVPGSFIPGAVSMEPGYLKSSLEKHARSMFESLI